MKNFIETILIAKADSVAIEVSESPSPSGDSWFNNPENLEAVERGLEDVRTGKCRAYSMEEIRQLLGE